MTESPYNSDSDQRYQLLLDWLLAADVSATNVVAASADASFRRYFRVSTAKQTLIAVDSPPQHNDNQKFINLAARLLESDVRTPKLICYSLEKGFMLIEDFGPEVLQHAVTNADAGSTELFYTDAFNTIATMQRAAPVDGLPLYDKAFLQTELHLFLDWFVSRHHRYKLSTEEYNTIEDVFDLCINNAVEQPQTFVHRDYHCRNLMPIDEAQKKLGVIDFQDAVVGPVTYDPVSLLKDAYLEWPEAFIQRFNEQHRITLNPTPTREQYVRWFDLMGLQRHIKILGIFCRLKYRDNKPQYFNDIPLVLRHIVRTTNNYPELFNFHQLLRSITRQ